MHFTQVSKLVDMFVSIINFTSCAFSCASLNRATSSSVTPGGSGGGSGGGGISSSEPNNIAKRISITNTILVNYKFLNYSIYNCSFLKSGQTTDTNKRKDDHKRTSVNNDNNGT